MKELNLRELRIKNGGVIKEIAKYMGKSRSHIERIEKEPHNHRLIEVEKYLDLIGYDVDFIDFIKACIDHKEENNEPKHKDVFTREELNSAVELERRRTNFYQQENLHLTKENENLKKDIENYKKVVLSLTTEKYCK